MKTKCILVLAILFEICPLVYRVGMIKVTETQGCIITLVLLPISILVLALCHLYVKRRYGWEDDDMPFIY